MERPFWTNEQVLSEMVDLCLDDVLTFASDILLRNLSVTCLAHGNVDNTIVSASGTMHVLEYLASGTMHVLASGTIRVLS